MNSKHNYSLSAIVNGKTSLLGIFSSRKKVDKELAHFRTVMHPKNLEYETVLLMKETYTSKRNRNVNTGPKIPGT
jgi:hypothetical protein